jgi:hypothetical protein
MRNACNILLEKVEGKRSLGRPKHRWEANIKMDHKETGCEVVDTGYVCLKSGFSGRLL